MNIKTIETELLLREKMDIILNNNSNAYVCLYVCGFL